MWKRKTHQQFLLDVKDRPFSVESIYTSSKEKVTFKCDIDQTVWMSMPHHILEGTGCPSCGRARGGKAHVKKNRVRVKEEWLEVDVSTKANPRAVMLIGKKDWEKIQVMGVGYVWAIKSKETKYAGCKIANKSCLVHRLLLPNAVLVDHENHNGLDNRRENIRPCSRLENNRNRKKGINNKSGVTGVGYHKRGRVWRARIAVEGVLINLGESKDKQEAIDFRHQAEIKYFKEFRYKEAAQ